MSSSRNSITISISSPLGSDVVAVSEFHSSSMPSSKIDFKSPYGNGLESPKQLINSGTSIANSRTVSCQELASHKETGDIWISLKGKVYDISDYVKKHPGGVQNILKGAGVEATTLFNSIHPWVKYDLILKEKYIGDLEGYEDTEEIDPLENYFQQDHNLSLSSLFPFCTTQQKRYSPPKTKFKQDNNNLFMSVKMSNVALEDYFDENNWAISILEGVGFLVLVMKVFLSTTKVWLLHLKLIDVLNDPDFDLFFLSPQRIQIKIHKPSLGRWKTLGIPLDNCNKVIENYLAPPNMHFATIVQKEFVSDNICHFVFEMSKSAFVGVPLGFDIKLELELEEGSITRQYTPVSSLMDFHYPTKRIVEWTVERKQILRCMIKIYPQGKLSSKLNNVPLGVPDAVKIGCCAGFFNPQWLDGVKLLILAPAGSGITPMFNIVKHFLVKDEEETEILMIYTNTGERDIALKNTWEKVDENYKWFHFVPICTDPSPTWNGLRGKPTAKMYIDIMSELLAQKYKLNDRNTKCAVCGPPGFVVATNKILNELGMTNDPNGQIFNFL